MKARSYGVALAAFAALMSGGIGLALWWSSGPSRLPPQSLPPTEGPLRWVAVGHVGAGTGTARQVREAALQVCASRGGCTGVVLLGGLTEAPLVDPDDPVLDERIGPWTQIAPTLLLLSAQDQADPRTRGAVLTWARRSEAVHSDSVSFSGQVADRPFFGLDSVELAAGGEGAQLQDQWVREALRATTARWRIAFASDPDPIPCDRFSLVVHGAARREWTHRCGGSWIAAGTGDGDGDPNGSLPEARTLYRDHGPGFALLEERGPRVYVGLYDATGRVSFEGELDADGEVTLMDGTVLVPGGSR